MVASLFPQCGICEYAGDLGKAFKLDDNSSMRLILLLTSLVLLATPLQAETPPDIGSMSNAQIIAQAPELHPAALYILSSRLLAEGNGPESANWMYAGQLRYRFLIAVIGDQSQDEVILFSALSEQVGRPVNEYIAGDPDEWIAAMQWALDWDEANDNPLLSKSEFAAELEHVRSGLESLILQVDGSRQEIFEQREANGLPNRWTP